ncbi:hypothetical protein [Parasitella parasitica]|uniref:Uncharacterized protein n=1 Tax=Parasitella parasitica TaxID=35722 RepID=A0A0B7MVD3_9FUNG|nr:hypothetical protein [Parasitella parasitica]
MGYDTITDKNYQQNRIVASFPNFRREYPAIVYSIEDHPNRGYGGSLAAACVKLGTAYLNHIDTIRGLLNKLATEFCYEVATSTVFTEPAAAKIDHAGHIADNDHADEKFAGAATDVAIAASNTPASDAAALFATTTATNAAKSSQAAAATNSTGAGNLDPSSPASVADNIFPKWSKQKFKPTTSVPLVVYGNGMKGSGLVPMRGYLSGNTGALESSSKLEPELSRLQSLLLTSSELQKCIAIIKISS